MATITVRVRADRGAVRQALLGLPAALAGGPDPLGVARPAAAALAHAVEEAAREADAVPRRQRQPVRRPRGLLTHREDKVWGGIFASRKRKGAPSEDAAKLAWGVLKRDGALTRTALRQQINERFDRALGDVDVRFERGRIDAEGPGLPRTESEAGPFLAGAAADAAPEVAKALGDALGRLGR